MTLSSFDLARLRSEILVFRKTRLEDKNLPGRGGSTKGYRVRLIFGLTDTEEGRDKIVDAWIFVPLSWITERGYFLKAWRRLEFDQASKSIDTFRISYSDEPIEFGDHWEEQYVTKKCKGKFKDLIEWIIGASYHNIAFLSKRSKKNVRFLRCSTSLEFNNKKLWQT